MLEHTTSVPSTSSRVHLPRLRLKRQIVHSCAVLGSGDVSEEKVPPNSSQLQLCGVNYCPSSAKAGNGTTEEENNNFQVDPVAVYTLAGVYLACSLAAPVIIAILVDPLSRQVHITGPD